jgi:apolipoprotein N-acyltransferase
MGLKPDHVRRITIAATAVLLSSAGFYLGTGLRPIWWITWIASLPVLLASLHLSARAAFAVALLAWLFGELNTWNYLRDLIHIPIALCLFILLLPALVFPFVVLLFRRLLLSGALWRAALSLPTAWVTYEYILSVSSPHSTFFNLAYSQMDCLPILQLASVTGVWGISFCILLLPSTMATVLGGHRTWRQVRRFAVTICLLFTTLFGFGYWRLHEPVTPVASVNVGLVASDLPQNMIAEDPDSALRLLREYSEQAEALATRGAQVIVIPEKTAVVLDSYRDSVDSLLQAAANRAGAILVVGVVDVTTKARWNEARIYSPGRTVPSTYAKHHMLPGAESNLTVGTARTELLQPSGKWGVTICKDMDFPLLSRQYSNDGTALLLVPAWDFTADGWLHGRMAILRGVEDGFSIARAPKQGILTLTDEHGRILAEEDTRSAPFATVLATVPVGHDDTFYARFGDWFAWLCIVGLLAGLCAGLLKRRLQAGPVPR